MCQSGNPTFCSEQQSCVPSQSILGIDVSNAKGTINWNSVYADGKKFAFIKATQRNNFTDPNFVTNINNARNVGILAGAYHFACPAVDVSQFCYTNGNATVEALNFINVAGPYITNGYLRPVLDLEIGSNLDNAYLSNWVHEFISVVKSKTGVEPIIYLNKDYAQNHLDSSVSVYDLWIAHLSEDPNLPPTPVSLGIWQTQGWDFMQYSWTGSVNGILGEVDLDTVNGDINTLNNYVISLSPLACGTTITQSTTLYNDIIGCAGNGLTISGTGKSTQSSQTSNIILDCNGHSIQGTNGINGIVIDNSDSVEVRNCVINGFNTNGIFLEESSYNIIDSNTITGANNAIYLLSSMADPQN